MANRHLWIINDPSHLVQAEAFNGWVQGACGTMPLETIECHYNYLARNLLYLIILARTGERKYLFLFLTNQLGSEEFIIYILVIHIYIYRFLGLIYRRTIKIYKDCGRKEAEAGAGICPQNTRVESTTICIVNNCQSIFGNFIIFNAARRGNA